ncbi:hypothetical protein HK105_205779 [Polyrhizophydium stewartii]|uniref:S phase cyclin A-associated protein in the endoplasmic reticulum N-terminal domain-containing protein n=1 Tax=Polyrhizophydium stewartii TaxID=2732419 RepID=A0ABR4N578_9FUNG
MHLVDHLADHQRRLYSAVLGMQQRAAAAQAAASAQHAPTGAAPLANRSVGSGETAGPQAMEARIKVDELLKSAVEHRFGRQEAFSTDIVRRALDELVSLYRENFRSPKALVAMLHEYISKLKEIESGPRVASWPSGGPLSSSASHFTSLHHNSLGNLNNAQSHLSQQPQHPGANTSSLTQTQNPYQAKNIAPTFLTQSLTDMPIQSSNHMPAVAPASEADQLPIGSLPMTFQSSAPMAHKSLPVVPPAGSNLHAAAARQPPASKPRNNSTLFDWMSSSLPMPGMGRAMHNRSTSWTSPPLARPFDYSPRRLLSPPITKQTLDPSELERKQAKAQELRESFQSLKAEKLRSRSDKVQAVKERKMDQSRKLKESIEEKLVKAERLRESRLKSIQTKAKDENAKRDEITFITALNTENKKIEVKQRHQETEARLQELEGERLRKMSEVAAMQEAALERRRLQEQERLAKLAREEERKREAEAKKDEERKQREEQRIANKTEKLKRLEAFKSSKEAVVSQMRRELDERLEKGIRRKDEQLQQVKEKAAAANHNARAVADRVNAIRRTPEKHMQTDEDGDATPDEPSSLGAGPSTPRTAPTGAQAPSLSPPRGLPDNRRGAPSPHLILAPTTSDASDTSPSKRKAEKRRLKRVRQKVHEASEMFMYFPPTELGDVDKISKEFRQQTARLANMLRQRIQQQQQQQPQPQQPQQPDASTEFSNEIQSAIDAIEIERELQALLDLLTSGTSQVAVCASGLLGLLVEACCGVDARSMSLLPQSTICLGLEVAQCAAALPATVEYLLRSSDLLSLRMVEQLSRVVPKCAVLPETAMPVASRLFDLLSTCLEHESANAQTAGVQEDLVEAIVHLGVVEKLRAVYLVVHGPVLPETSLATFLRQSCRFVEAVSSPRLAGIAGRPFYERKQLRPHANSLASVFGQSDLCGLVTMLDSVLLFKVGNARTAAEESLPIVCIEIAAAILRTLNNICALDLCMVQSVLAAHGLSTECFHLILFWIQYWDKWSPTARGAFAANAAGVSQDQERGLLLDELLRELLVFLGNICLDNPKLAEMARLGSTQGPVMLRRLCLLPPRYFIEPTRQQALLPTLIVLTAHDDVNRLILEEEVSEQMLALFLQRHARRADEPKAGGAHMSLAMRLPERLRDPALFSSASKQAAE